MSTLPAPAPPQNESSPPPDPQLSPSGTAPEARPALGQRATTLVNPSTSSDDPEKKQDDDRKTDDGHASDEKTQAEHHHAREGDDVVNPVKGNDVANPDEVTPLWQRIAMDIALMFLILVMIVWPWVFFGVVKEKDGLQMYGRLAEVIDRYPQKVGAVVTFLSTIITAIVTFVFGKVIVRLGQEVIAADKEVTVFGVSAMLAFRHATLVWGIGQWRQLKNGKGRWAILVLLLACLGAFKVAPTGIAGLITPGQFNKTVDLTGTELDFASNDPGCLAWLEENRVGNDCDWKTVAGTQFTSCLGENQMLDVLDSGRAQMLSAVIGVSETSSLNQLGAEGGLRFLGSAKGVLPIGPNGVLAFDTLKNASIPSSDGHAFKSVSNPFSDDLIRRRMVSYNYTVTQQGLESGVSCSYESTSPIRYRAVPFTNTTLVASFDGTCDSAVGLEPMLENVLQYTTLNTKNTLTFWACKQTPQPGFDPTYFIYLRGMNNYESSIGNIACQISPIRFHDYQVQYLSVPKYFTAQAVTPIDGAPRPTTFARYTEDAIRGLGNIVWESQNWSSNLVAEAVFSLGAKELNLSTRQQDPMWLRLYEGMIKGMLEYEATYSRLAYNVAAAIRSPPPSACLRQVGGPVSYAVRGWYIQDAATQAGLLIPMTLINLASFSLLIACFVIGKFKYKYNFDATDNISLLTAFTDGVTRGTPGEVEWRSKVEYPQTKV